MIDPPVTHQSKIDVGIRGTIPWDQDSLLPIDWKLKV